MVFAGYSSFLHHLQLGSHGLATIKQKKIKLLISDGPKEELAAAPDLYKLMETLEGGESDLETEGQPPSLFTRPEHVPNYRKISQLKLQMEEEEIEGYVEDFEKTIHDDVLMIGSISLDEVQVIIKPTHLRITSSDNNIIIIIGIYIAHFHS